MWNDVLVVERSAGGALPADRAALHQFGEQVGLLFEQALVVGEVVAEERERLDAGAAAEDHLGPAARDRVQGRVALKNAHRIVGAEHDHRRAEMDSLRPGGDRGEHDIAGGHRKVAGVMLSDPEEVDLDPVCEDALLDDAADRFRVCERPSVTAPDQVAEGVEAENERERRRRALFTFAFRLGDHGGHAAVSSRWPVGIETRWIGPAAPGGFRGSCRRSCSARMPRERVRLRA